MAVKVGVIGLGMMGLTHLDVYGSLEQADVTAISDLDPDRLAGKSQATGNIKGQAQSTVAALKVERFSQGMDLIAKADVDVVDICLSTPFHLEYVRAALEAGKHVIVEKPLARTAEQAREVAQLAEASSQVVMSAMCMRFWPQWEWLKQAIDDGRYGPVRSARFRRVGSHPGGAFYADGDACGGALLDLHIHDSDFVQWCFGMPKVVFSQGYCKETSAIDHVFTNYLYEDGPVVTAEGGWCFAQGSGFQMQYEVNFENATARFDIAKDQSLELAQDGKVEPVQVKDGLGYFYELEYAMQCIDQSREPSIVTARDAANSVVLVEAEQRSIAEQKAVVVNG